jgi:hypothetical protein
MDKNTKVIPRTICTPISYKTLEQFCEGSNLPATATNDKGENVVITTEPFESSKCYRLDTYQENGWIRSNHYYPNGDTDECYDR